MTLEEIIDYIDEQVALPGHWVYERSKHALMWCSPWGVALQVKAYTRETTRRIDLTLHQGATHHEVSSQQNSKGARDTICGYLAHEFVSAEARACLSLDWEWRGGYDRTKSEGEMRFGAQGISRVEVVYVAHTGRWLSPNEINDEYGPVDIVTEGSLENHVRAVLRRRAQR